MLWSTGRNFTVLCTVKLSPSTPQHIVNYPRHNQLLIIAQNVRKGSSTKVFQVFHFSVWSQRVLCIFLSVYFMFAKGESSFRFLVFLWQLHQERPRRVSVRRSRYSKARKHWVWDAVVVKLKHCLIAKIAENQKQTPPDCVWLWSFAGYLESKLETLSIEERVVDLHKKVLSFPSHIKLVNYFGAGFCTWLCCLRR